MNFDQLAIRAMLVHSQACRNGYTTDTLSGPPAGWPAARSLNRETPGAASLAPASR